MAEEQKFVSIVSLDLPCMDFITALGFGGNRTFNEFRYVLAFDMARNYCKPWV